MNVRGHNWKSPVPCHYLISERVHYYRLMWLLVVFQVSWFCHLLYGFRYQPSALLANSVLQMCMCIYMHTSYVWNFLFPFPFPQVPTMRVPDQLMPTWTPMQRQGLHLSISLLQVQPSPGRLLSMLPGRPNWWELPAMQQYPLLAPHRGKGSNMGSRKNRVPPQLHGLRGHCCV